MRAICLIQLFLLSVGYSGARHIRHHALKQETQCGYQSCPKGDPNAINVHIVPHTHNDVGWLKTVDQYYYGSRNDIQNAGVQYILDSVVDALLQNPDRKFIYVETAFLWRWLQEQDQQRLGQVRDLVNQGRLTIINGAWSMNDEATTHYSSIIENFAWGLRRLKDTFGDCGRPNIGWQIDPFGHSREFANLLTQIGFDGLFLGRIDYEDKTARQLNKTMEMLWLGSDSVGSPSQLFTGVLPNTYSPPAGFCFDILCDDTPIMDDTRLNDYNVNEEVSKFIDIMNKQAASYATNHLIVTMGEDFNYQDANKWFKNLDKLIFHVNQRQANGSKINLFYSTPACYLYALNNAGHNWPTKSDDFFPYASDPHAFWTGYFTSRPAVKRFDRVGSNVLSVCKQVSYFAGLGEDSKEKITKLREAVGVYQHHDAVTGTEKQAVAYDYAQRMDTGIKSCQEVIAEGIAKLASVSLGDIAFCDLLNISRCTATEDSALLSILLWNPLARNVQSYIELPVSDGGTYLLTDASGSQVSFQITPVFDAFENAPGAPNNATQLITFLANLTATGYTTYTLKKTANEHPGTISKIFRPRRDSDDTVLSNSYIAASFDVVTGLLKSITNVETGDVIAINQTFEYYVGAVGDNSQFEKRSSGAYIFRPNCTLTPANCRYPVSTNPTYEVVLGPMVQEIRQSFGPWVSQIVRLREKSRHLEFEWQVGPIPIDDNVGKEVVTVFQSDMKSAGMFYTDSNARQNILRKRDFRPSYQLNKTEPISENYYPVNNRIFIQDPSKGTQLTIVTDRAQGGSSMLDGSLELMVHRRLLHDDAFGVGEALNETGDGPGLVVRGKHYLQFSKTSTAASDYRLLNQEAHWQPYPIFVRSKTFPRKHKPFGVNLPLNVHLLSLEEWDSGQVLIRLEHIFEKDEDPNYSLPVLVDLQKIIPTPVRTVTEMTLDGNAPLSSIHRLVWKSENGSYDKNYRKPVSDSFNITMNPMEIRTFLVKLK